MCNPLKILLFLLLLLSSIIIIIIIFIIVVVCVVLVIKLTDMHQKKINNVDSDKSMIQLKFHLFTQDRSY